MHSMNHIRVVGLGCALALLGGCASATLPVQLPAEAEATAAIDSARADGAEEWAPEILAAAVEKATAARLAAHKGKADRARLLSDEATADAELAQASALTVRTRIQIEQVRASTDSLRQATGASVH